MAAVPRWGSDWTPTTTRRCAASCSTCGEVGPAWTALRDGSPADPHHPDNQRYLLGHRLYEEACDPSGRAALVVGCEDWDRPQLLRS